MLTGLPADQRSDLHPGHPVPRPALSSASRTSTTYPPPRTHAMPMRTTEWDWRVHSRGAVNWRQAMAGSGGSQGFPAMALLMASSAMMP